MIDRIDRELEAWARSLLGEVGVVFAPPRQETTDNVVLFFLTDLKHTQPIRGGRGHLLEMAARYLVAVWANDPLEEHRLLAELAFAAMRSGQFELELEAPPLELWTALGSRPRASFHLRVPIRQKVERPKAKPVLEPPQLRRSKMGPWEGVLLGPGEVPVAGARVEFPRLHRSVTTDANGRFRLTGVGLDWTPKEAKVFARGKEFIVSATDWGGEEGMATIRLQGLEV